VPPSSPRFHEHDIGVAFGQVSEEVVGIKGMRGTSRLYLSELENAISRLAEYVSTTSNGYFSAPVQLQRFRRSLIDY
jgi:hypothetical protein